MIAIDISIPPKCTDCPFATVNIFSNQYLDECILYSHGVPGRYHLSELSDRPDWCELKEIGDSNPCSICQEFDCNYCDFAVERRIEEALL